MSDKPETTTDILAEMRMGKESPVVMRFASRLTRIIEDLTAPGGV